MCVCERPCHALERPLQDPIPRALWDSPMCSFSIRIPHPAPLGFPGTPCVTHSPMLPCEPHQRHGPPWMESACWCHTESYLTQQRIELVPTQHRFTAEGSILCLRVGRCPASCPAALSLLSFCSGPLLMFSPSPGAVPAHAPPVQLH